MSVISELNNVSTKPDPSIGELQTMLRLSSFF